MEYIQFVVFFAVVGDDMSRILIIEDEAGIARFVELELKHEGNEVEKAADGREGLDKPSPVRLT